MSALAQGTHQLPDDYFKRSWHVVATEEIHRILNDGIAAKADEDVLLELFDNSSPSRLEMIEGNIRRAVQAARTGNSAALLVDLRDTLVVQRKLVLAALPELVAGLHGEPSQEALETVGHVSYALDRAELTGFLPAIAPLLRSPDGSEPQFVGMCLVEACTRARMLGEDSVLPVAQRAEILESLQERLTRRRQDTGYLMDCLGETEKLEGVLVSTRSETGRKLLEAAFTHIHEGMSITEMARGMTALRHYEIWPVPELLNRVLAFGDILAKSNASRLQQIYVNHLGSFLKTARKESDATQAQRIGDYLRKQANSPAREWARRCARALAADKKAASLSE